MCPGRDRFENKVGMRHVTYFADRIGSVVQMLLPSLGKRELTCVSWVTKSRARSTLQLCSPKLNNVRMAPALGGFQAHQVRIVHGTR